MLYPVYQAVILAAGRGKRLRPYTDLTPKPLLPKNGRPLLDSVLEALKQVGIQRVLIVTHYLGEQIENYVQKGAKWGVEVSYHRQEPLLGTAHALQQVTHFLTAATLITAADYALPPSYFEPLLEKYEGVNQQHPAGQHMVVSLKQLPPAAMSQSSSVAFNPQGQITHIVEKPAAGLTPSPYSASLIYVVPAAVTHFLPQAPLSERGEYEFPAVVNEMITAGYILHGVLQPPPQEITLAECTI